MSGNPRWTRLDRPASTYVRILGHPALLAALVGLLGLLLASLVALPALRPGLDPAWPGGNPQSAWGALHPAVAALLRVVLAGIVLASGARLTETVWPAPPRNAALQAVCQATGDTASGSELWNRVLASVTSVGWQVIGLGEGPEGRHAVVAASRGRRLWAASLYLGILLVSLALALLWRWGWAASSPSLVLDAPQAMDGHAPWRLALDELALRTTPAGVLHTERALVSVTTPAGSTRVVRLAVGGARRYEGHWLLLAQDLPAARIVALDRQGGGLELYPMVGSRAPGRLQRIAFENQEEHLLAVPEANLLIRLVYLQGEGETGYVHVQALDGRDGASLAEAFVQREAPVDVDGVTLWITAERAIRLGILHAPGDWLLLLGATLVLVGGLGHVVAPPICAGLLLLPEPEPETWRVFVAAPPHRSDAAVARLREALCADLAAPGSP